MVYECCVYSILCIVCRLSLCVSILILFLCFHFFCLFHPSSSVPKRKMKPITESDEMNEEDEGQMDDAKVKRERAANWSQIETETLCSLIMERGRNGILNKMTNGATVERKNREWQNIVELFNASPEVRHKFPIISFRFSSFFFVLCFIFAVPLPSR